MRSEVEQACDESSMQDVAHPCFSRAFMVTCSRRMRGARVTARRRIRFPSADPRTKPNVMLTHDAPDSPCDTLEWRTLGVHRERASWLFREARATRMSR